MRCSTLLTIMAAVLLYLVIGALVFGWLEAPREEQAYNQLLRSRLRFLDKHNCVQENNLSEFTQVHYLYAQVNINILQDPTYIYTSTLANAAGPHTCRILCTELHLHD